MRNTETTVATLYQLRSLGMQIALDDFGTGYSSLSYLRSFPFDKLKIDRCFIAGLADGEEAVNIVRAVTGLARSLQMSDDRRRRRDRGSSSQQVRDLGCTEMQGNLFSPAIPIARRGAFHAPRQRLPRRRLSASFGADLPAQRAHRLQFFDLRSALSGAAQALLTRS